MGVLVPRAPLVNILRNQHWWTSIKIAIEELVRIGRARKQVCKGKAGKQDSKEKKAVREDRSKDKISFGAL